VLKRLKYIKTILWFTAIIWITFVLSQVYHFNRFGIIPRHEEGVVGIVAAPFLHGSYMHLFANTAGLLLFGIVSALIEGKNTTRLLAFIIIVGGGLTWIFGRPAVHIGASGLVFGLFGYLALLGFFHKKFSYMLISLVTLFFYGTMIFGVLPGQQGVSFESHFFGFIAGGVAAKIKSLS